jgi:hypothetical protein
MLHNSDLFGLSGLVFFAKLLLFRSARALGWATTITILRGLLRLLLLLEPEEPEA